MRNHQPGDGAKLSEQSAWLLIQAFFVQAMRRLHQHVHHRKLRPHPGKRRLPVCSRYARGHVTTCIANRYGMHAIVARGGCEKMSLRHAGHLVSDVGSAYNHLCNGWPDDGLCMSCRVSRQVGAPNDTGKSCT